MEGLITTTQRLSIHDGPGIRTTVFLKGCNLRCRWCHNPETWSSLPQLQQLNEKCVVCGRCNDVCPWGAISINSNGIEIDRERCSACGLCAKECPSGALMVVGRMVDSSEIVAEIAEDMPYYMESGGGVTISGGEPLCQLNFTTEILKECKSRGIHTAIETNLSASPNQIEQIIPFVDLWMVDLKCADESTHKQQTGVTNQQIISNISFLSQRGCRIIVRTPVIPGVNDNKDEIENICKILSKLNISKYELLPFHPLGFDKFMQFGMVNPITEPIELERGLIDQLRDIVKQYIK